MEFWVESQDGTFIVRPYGVRITERFGCFIIECITMNDIGSIELGRYTSFSQADMVMSEIRSQILAGDNYYKMPDDKEGVDYDKE